MSPSKYHENQNKASYLLKDIISVQEVIKAIYIVGSDGAFYTSDWGIKEDELKKNYESFINDASSNEQYYVGSHQNDYNSFVKPYAISYVRPIFDSSTGKKLCTIIVDMSYDYLKEAFTISSIKNDEKVLVVSQDGQNIFTYPYNIVLDDIIQNNPELLRLDHAELNKKVFGKDSIIISNTIEYSNWKIIKVISTDRIYKDTSTVRNVTIMVSFLFILIALSVSFILSHTVTKPILELNKKVRLVESGNLSANINVKSNDELGDLSRSFNNMVHQLKEMINKQVLEQKKKSDMEFELLQSQINPHFLYNTLDSIKWLAVIQNINNISEMITSLINLLKYNISKNKASVTLSEEIESVKNYITIQKFRYGDMFSVEYDIAEDALNCSVLRLMLQPIIENTILHGFENIEGNGIIKIQASITTNRLVVSVIDNGSGMKEENFYNVLINSKKKFSGLGLNNIQERIKLYFGEEYGLSFESEPGKGTTVTVTLPVTIYGAGAKPQA